MTLCLPWEMIVKQCKQCKLTLPLKDFYKDKRPKIVNPGRYARCIACVRGDSAIGAWDSQSYMKAKAFTQEELYVIARLARIPSTVHALDELYKRNPQRWHQIIVAATLHKKEMND